MNQHLLKIEDASVQFAKRRTLIDLLLNREKKILKAVENFNLEIFEGEIIGLVGESGSGKSSLIKSLVGINRLFSGRVFFKQKQINFNSRENLRFVSKNVQMVFQDPYSSLNPAFSIFDTLKEVISFHNPKWGCKLIKTKIFELMEMVGLNIELKDRKPKTLSGGQRQRVGIARALAVNPELLLLDEPVTALDVSIQAQILNLLKTLSSKLSLTMILVAHELSVIDFLCDKVAVMYLGKIVEFGTCKEIFNNPKHPYTRALIESVPKLTTKKRTREAALSGDIPSPFEIPMGCRFQSRCKYAVDKCLQEEPIPLYSSDGHYSLCHFPQNGSKS